MRDPGTEPMVMISGDVMELHHLIYAEREAHAAEVANYRRALEAIRDQFPQDLWDKLRVPEIAVAALAAPPTAAVQAVEGMRRALEGTTCKCRRCCPKRCFDCDVMIGSYCPGCGNEYKAEELLVVQCARCAALTAWKEATRG